MREPAVLFCIRRISLLSVMISLLSTSPRRCWATSTAKVQIFSVVKDLPDSLTIITGQKLNANQDLGVKVATPVGTLVGQLLFGWLADIVGRKRMCKPLSVQSFLLSMQCAFFQTVSS
jgi:MFS family permease